MASPAATEIVSDGAAQSVQGPTVGFCDITVSTSEEGVDLTAWAGRYVTIYVETDDAYIAFTTAAANVIVLTAQAAGTVGVPLRVYLGQPVHLVVPKSAPFLRYRSVASAASAIRVVPS